METMQRSQWTFQLSTVLLLVFENVWSLTSHRHTPFERSSLLQAPYSVVGQFKDWYQKSWPAIKLRSPGSCNGYYDHSLLFALEIKTTRGTCKEVWEHILYLFTWFGLVLQLVPVPGSSQRRRLRRCFSKLCCRLRKHSRAIPKEGQIESILI